MHCTTVGIATTDRVLVFMETDPEWWETEIKEGIPVKREGYGSPDINRVNRTRCDYPKLKLVEN